MSKDRRIYRVNPDEKTLKPLDLTSFASMGFKENADIHEWLAKTPEILGEDLIVIAREDIGFTDRRSRPDLLCIDSEGNLVIVEVKRDDSGQGVYWQALMYAATYSTYKTNDLIKRFAKHAHIDDEEARQQISDHTEGRDSTIGQKQRIVLVAGSFPTPVTTTVLWLREREIDISCIEIKLFKDRDAHYLQATQIVPLPDTNQYLVKCKNLEQERTRIREKAESTRDRDDEITRFMVNITEKLKDQLKSEEHLIPTPEPKYADRPSGGGYRHWRLWLDGMEYGHWLIILNETTRARAGSRFNLFVGFRAWDFSMRDALGSSEEHGAELKRHIAKLAEDNALKYYDVKKGRVNIANPIEVSTQLDDADARKVAAALAGFIRKYQPLIHQEFQAVSAKLNNPDSEDTAES